MSLKVNINQNASPKRSMERQINSNQSLEKLTITLLSPNDEEEDGQINIIDDEQSGQKCVMNAIPKNQTITENTVEESDSMRVSVLRDEIQSTGTYIIYSLQELISWQSHPKLLHYPRCKDS